MIDRPPPDQRSESGHGTKLLRKALATLLATTALGVVSAQAVDGTWTGPGNEWTNPANWSSNPSVPNATATFTINEPTAVESNGAVTIGTVQFSSAPNAQAYTITANDLFLVNGAGMINNSSNPQTLNTTATTLFQNSSSASGGITAMTHVNSGAMLFQNSSTAGTAIVTNNSVLQFFDTSKGGSAQIANNATVDFFDASAAGNANIASAATGAISFNNTSTAGNATITLLAPISPDASQGSLQFNNSSSAGNAAISTAVASFATITFNGNSTAANSNITLVDATLVFNNSSTAGSATVSMTNAMHPGSIIFNDTASAGNSNITNVANLLLGTSIQFLGASTAGNATITNNPGAPAGEGGTLLFGAVGGTDTSNAGTAHITNNQFGSTGFLANTSAMNATIVNNNGGNTNFQDQSTAGNASIVNNSGGTTSFGIPLVGTDTATAGSAVITNNSGGATTFLAATTAGSATIINNPGGIVQFGDSGGANDTASAGNSTINNSGVVSFNSKTTAGAATITTNSGGKLSFFDTSSGGNARFITNAGGTFDISALTSAGTTAGSIEGAGSYFIGSKNLAVGSNNLSTTVSGVIADGGTGGGTGGSLTKVGAGTLILAGNNTYTGDTTISAGSLQLGNGGASGSIIGNVVDNGIFAINRSDAFVFSGLISGSGQFQQLGTGATTFTTTNTYSGLTTVANGTLTLAGGVGLVGDVLNNATFNINGGALHGFVTNNGVVNANGGSDNTGVTNNGQFNVSGFFSGLGGFINSAGATVAIGPAATLDFFDLDNSGAVTTAAGSQLNALNLKNRAGGTIAIAAGAKAFSSNSGVGGMTNAGTVTNNGIAQIDVNSNSGTITNGPSGTWNGRFDVNSGLITNNGTWTAHIVIPDSLTINTGTFVNNGTYSSNANTHAAFFSFRNSGTLTNTGIFNSSLNNVSGGILTTAGTIGGNLANSGTVNANGGAINGVITNNGGGVFNVGGTVTTDSSFTNAANATLAVGTAGAYTLQGLLSNSGAITVAGGGQLIATTSGITNNAGGTITVAVGGTVKDDLNNAGVVVNNGTYVANVASNTGSGTITNAATGTWTGNVLSNAASITNSGIWIGNVVSNTGAINNNGAWTGTVSNAGTFNNNAGATLSGLLTNTAGTTTNNGALNGGANVSGGTFTGSGTVTNLTVSGGTFAPGNGTPGTFMTVSGNLAFQSGAMYLVTLNPSTATLASVGGSASLNGTAAAVYLAGNYVSKKYTILTAAGGVNGTFGSLVNTNVPANFTSTLSYDSNNAYINLALNFVPNPAPNFGPGLTINQQNVANTLVNFFNTTGGIPLAFGSLTPTGLTQASGELGTGIIQTAIKADDLFLNLLLDPSVAGRAGGFASSPMASQFAADDQEGMAYAAKRKASPAERDAYAMATKAPYLAPYPVSRWSVWGAAYGGAARVDGNAVVGSHDLNARVWGVVGGADYKLTPDALVGFALSGGGTNYSLSDALGNARSDLFQAGVFGRQNIGAAYLSAALAYGWHDVTTNRTVAVPGGDVLQARFRAETFSARFEGGYRFETTWAGLTPYVAAQAISFHLPGYAEQTLGGLGTFALTYAGQTTTATRTELGLRSDRSWAMQDGIFTLRGRAAWAHDYNNDRAVTAIFQTLPGTSFVVNGARANPDAALLSAGAEMKWRTGFSLAATFEGEFSGNSTSYAGKGVARYTW